MSYAEGEMPEIQDASEEATQQKDLRVAELEGEFYRRLANALPHLFADKTAPAALLKLAHQLAEERVALEEESTRLQQLSDRDPYNPEIYSANGWYRVMKDKLAELRRDESHAWLLAFDIDGFKAYNDTNGHVEGDNALGVAGQLAKSVLRQEAIVARLHGDEFVVLLPNMDLKSLVLIGERVRETLSQMSTVLGTPIPLTASIGMAMIPEEVVQTKYDSDEQLIKALNQSYALADQAERVAKRAGKNTLCVRTEKDGKFRIFAGLKGGELIWQNPPPNHLIQ